MKQRVEKVVILCIIINTVATCQSLFFSFSQTGVWRMGKQARTRTHKHTHTEAHFLFAQFSPRERRELVELDGGWQGITAAREQQGHGSNDEVNFRKQAMRRKWRVVIRVVFLLLSLLLRRRALLFMLSAETSVKSQQCK